jgi:hypothetical protein
LYIHAKIAKQTVGIKGQQICLISYHRVAEWAVQQAHLRQRKWLGEQGYDRCAVHIRPRCLGAEPEKQQKES